MTDPLFLARLGEMPGPGETVTVDGSEGHHAVVVKRLGVGEEVLIADGEGRAVQAVVVGVAKGSFTAEVVRTLHPSRPALMWTVAQALAKGERSELAVQMATELGAHSILAWQADRSIVRWQGQRGERSLAKWRATAREATKQARRFRVPEVLAVDTDCLAETIGQADIALVLHEEADCHIADLRPPETGTGVVVVGPEGGITPRELERLREAGASPVSISDGVLRTSTAAAVALGQLEVLVRWQ